MKRLIASLVLALAASSAPAGATTVGVSISKSDTFIKIVSKSIESRAAATSGVTLKLENADGDVARQLQTVKDLVAAKVDALVVMPVDGDTGPVISKLASDAGIPLVYVNSEPVNIDSLAKGQSYVGSDERDSGTLETREICRRLGGKGDVVVMMGELQHFAARRRTDDVAEVLATPDCKGIRVVERQSANWSRPQAEKQMNEWLQAGVKFDGVIANNDDMALGAIRALKAAGYSMDRLVVGGVDATADALGAMKDGDLDVTIFQNARGQGETALDTAVKLAGGADMPTKIYIPFELVTAENLANYAARN
ncbi:rhizopine-binding protein [Aureimonas endophytica]|uniref:Rhizopine-binding protein n=1 Tax=Aureimonas endophytica TaxID=2027858 RepID=A0A917EED5_9HYPH|nr:substrate-binding domain-containing protein [Aureimonas endophytica]GGE23688.1 rhizopine-binding protein [Aureimonas endophytica]